MKRILTYSIFSLLVFSSCHKKETETVAPTLAKEKEDPTTLFLKDARNDPESEYYISGEFNGHKIYCATNYYWDERYGQIDRYNAFFRNDSLKIDNGMLYRSNSDNSIQLGIFFSQTDLHHQSLPGLWPRSLYRNCENIAIQLVNKKTENHYIFHSSIFPKPWREGQDTSKCQVNFIVTSFQDDIIEGRFEGNMQDLDAYVDGKSRGTIIPVRNGRFRIKALTYDVNSTFSKPLPFESSPQ